MEITLISRVLMRRWWLIAIPVVIAAVFAVPRFLSNEQAGAGGFTTSFRYSASQQASNLNPRDGDYQDVWLASEFVVNAFTDWVQSSSFRDELAAIVGNPELLAGFAIAADNNRSIGVVYMSHPDGAALATLRDAAITVLETRSQDYFPHLGSQPAQVTILDKPALAAAPPPLTNRFAPVLQLGAAFFAGLILAGVAEYFDKTLRYKDEVDSLGLKVLASIPKHR